MRPIASRVASAPIWRDLPAGRRARKSGCCLGGKYWDFARGSLSNRSAMAWATDASVLRFSPCSRRLWARRCRSMARSITATVGVPARAAGQGVTSDMAESGEALLHHGPDLLVEGVGRQRAVEHDDALGPLLREQEVALADLLVESDVLALHAVRQVGGALAHALEADLGGHVDDDGEVGHHVADGEAIDLADRARGEVAGDALVNRRGVEEPVAQDHRAAGE